MRMEFWFLTLSLTKHSACFLCLPVDRPPMEPSKYVSLVPKYPDKMGFDEVGKVSICVCTCMRVQAYVFILEHKPELVSESQQDWLGC